MDQELTISPLLMNRSGSCLVSLERYFQGLSNGRHYIARRLDSMENVLFSFCATHFKYTVFLTNVCTSPFVWHVPLPHIVSSPNPHPFSLYFHVFCRFFRLSQSPFGACSKFLMSNPLVLILCSIQSPLGTLGSL